jgi:uncharacterized phage protein (TIGR02216 family)
MRLGLGVLGIAPLVFWSLTPRELQAILCGRFGQQQGDAPSRRELHAMMQRFPDSEVER